MIVLNFDDLFVDTINVCALMLVINFSDDFYSIMIEAN